MSTQNQPSLYDRLGGVYSIATVVDDFIERVMADPRLKCEPRRATYRSQKNLFLNMAPLKILLIYQPQPGLSLSGMLSENRSRMVT